MLQEQMTLPIGATVRDNNGSSYVVEAILGVGGFSAVYKVRDRRAKYQVFALKEVINPNLEDKRSLSTEAALLMRLHYPSLPRVYQVFERVNLKRIYLLMDYIEGKNLEVLRREEPDSRFSVEFVLAVMTPIVNAIIYLHSQNPPIVHRDIKPPNIIVPTGAGEAILVDFGLAKEYIEEKTTNILRFGTPGYAAPEQYAQGTNLRTDVYGLGSTLYTLLTGVKPTDALIRIVNNEGRDLLKRADTICSKVPTSVAKVLDRAMSLRTEDRFSSIQEFWQAFRFSAEHPEYEEPGEVVSQSLTLRLDTLETRQTLPLSVGNDEIHTVRLPTAPRYRLFPLLPVLVFLGVLSLLFFWLPTRYPAPAPAVHYPAIKHTILSSNACASPTVTGLPISNYPLLMPCYSGTIDDIGVAKEKTNLYLTEIKQNQGNLSGHFQGLNVAGTFEGTILQNGDISFVATLLGRTDTIVFKGSSKYGGDMSGSFEVHDKNGQSTFDEYGGWYAQPWQSS